jgi:hypothetical protein
MFGLIRKYMKAYSSAVYVTTGPHGKYQAIPNRDKSLELYNQIKSIPNIILGKDAKMKKTIEDAVNILENNLHSFERLEKNGF